MSNLIREHQSKIIAVLIVIGVAFMIWLDQRRESGPVLPKGQPGPSFSLTLLQGSKKITSESLRGQPVVLDFWATWCHPCRASLPHVDELAKRYEGRAHFIAVNAQSEDPAQQQETSYQLHLSMPIATDGQEAANAFKVEKLPTTVILDRDGRVVEIIEGPTSSEHLERSLSKLL